MNWDDTRIFLALTRAPSLRAAARSLGVDQATVGRRLNALEAELGAKLFLRAKDGYLLTAAGETALGAARRMESAALDLRTRIEGQDIRLFTRNGHDWSRKMPRQVAALRALGIDTAWLDGEMVVADENGMADFQALQNAFDTCLLYTSDAADE